MQENGTEQLKVYRRTRSMLKIRCTPTEVEQTRYRNSQSTETEKAEFHTPAIPNTARNHIEENSLENVSSDLVQLTVTTPDTQASASFDSKSEEREEIADVPALERIEEQSTHTPGSRKSTRKNFGNSVADISILGQFCTYLQFRGEKYLNTFIVTNANDCPNLLSHGATFRMGVLASQFI